MYGSFIFMKKKEEEKCSKCLCKALLLWENQSTKTANWIETAIQIELNPLTIEQLSFSGARFNLYLERFLFKAGYIRARYLISVIYVSSIFF